MYTNRILFCTGPDVKFEFLHPTTTELSSMVAPPLSFKGIPWIPHFNGQKVGISNKRVIGLPKNPPRFWPDQKKSDPMTRLVSNFFAASRGDPIKSYRCTALEGRQSGIFGSALHFWRAFCSALSSINSGDSGLCLLKSTCFWLLYTIQSKSDLM